jgi:hypothetical protein
MVHEKHSLGITVIMFGCEVGFIFGGIFAKLIKDILNFIMTNNSLYREIIKHCNIVLNNKLTE